MILENPDRCDELFQEVGREGTIGEKSKPGEFSNTCSNRAFGLQCRRGRAEWLDAMRKGTDISGQIIVLVLVLAALRPFDRSG
jgi:hypothetical protein